ncbi:MAG: translation initiation factor [Campylobacterota bacterium]|nr:translation initiation factor [Campylobacterota bacterium]
MSRGKKLDLNIGADFGSDWNEVKTAQLKIKVEITEPSKHQLYFKKEKRRGKVVTLVGPLHVKRADAEALLKKFKKKLGTGGSFKEEFMEFQGDIQPRVRELFEAEGYRFKR